MRHWGFGFRMQVEHGELKEALWWQLLKLPSSIFVTPFDVQSSFSLFILGQYCYYTGRLYVQQSTANFMSVRHIASLTGLSAATVSRSLRGDLKVAASTREKVLQAAKEVGYGHNPLIGRMMSTLRRRDSQTFRGNLAVLVKSLRSELLEDTRVKDVVQGAFRRAKELGFAIDRSNLDETAPSPLQRILFARGVVGVLVFMPSFGGSPESLDMDFSQFCCVAAGWGLWKPEMDTVHVDYHQTIRLILENSIPTFGSGIAAIWDFATDEASHRVAKGAFLTHHSGGVSSAEKLFLSRQEVSRELLTKLVQKHKIQSVILGSSYKPPDWLAEVIPRQNWVWCRDPGSTPHFGWVNYQNQLLGEWGINLLAAKLQMNQTGLPDSRQSVLVPALWNQGTVS